MFLKGDGDKIWKKDHVCRYVIKEHDGSRRCNIAFNSANQLLEHKKQVGHILQKRRKNNTVATRPTKQLRMEDVFKNMQARRVDEAEASSDDDEDSDEDEDLVACIICKIFFL